MGQITATFTVDPSTAAAFVALFTPSPEEEAATMARIMSASLVSGMEVVYDLSAFGYDWSPVFLHPTEQPLAWVAADGSRSEGPDYPG